MARKLTYNQKVMLFANACHMRELYEGSKQLNLAEYVCEKQLKHYNDYLKGIKRNHLESEFQEFLDGTFGINHVWDDFKND